MKGGADSSGLLGKEIKKRENKSRNSSLLMAINYNYNKIEIVWCLFAIVFHKKIGVSVKQKNVHVCIFYIGGVWRR